jgi:hypothetical protein
MQLRSSASLFALVAMLAIPGAVQAQERNVYKLPMPAPPGAVGMETGRATPGVTTTSPIGYGPSAGDIFAGVGYQMKTRYDGDSDGSLAVGGGFFNPSRYVGLEVVLVSASTFRSGFGDRMYAAAKVHKSFAKGFGVGVGVEGISLSGDNTFDPSVYAAITTVQRISQGQYFNSVTWNAGLGNGRFQSEDNVAADENGIGVFASAALRAAWHTSMILDYTGQDLNIGLSFTPFREVPLVLSPAVADVLGQAGDQARLMLGVGFSWKY